MPIYAYRCEACGFAKDVLQKMSDPVLTVCLSCGLPTFKKQLTAAGFQLKGTGWYVTDFRNGNAPATAVAPSTDSGASKAAETPSSSDKAASSSAAAPAPVSAPASTPSSAPAASGDKK